VMVMVETSGGKSDRQVSQVHMKMVLERDVDADFILDKELRRYLVCGALHNPPHSCTTRHIPHDKQGGPLTLQIWRWGIESITYDINRGPLIKRPGDRRRLRGLLDDTQGL
jgi:hypothetical protein